MKVCHFERVVRACTDSALQGNATAIFYSTSNEEIVVNSLEIIIRKYRNIWQKHQNFVDLIGCTQGLVSDQFCRLKKSQHILEK